MVGCNSSRTPVDTESKLGDGGTPVVDPTLYRSLAGSLQYLTFTRPDITYAVQQVCLYMHDPREPHFSALKRILRNLGTWTMVLQLFSSTTDSLLLFDAIGWLPTTRTVYFSAEAEYRGVANVVAETCWIRNLLRELHTPLSSATIVYCDNVSDVYLSSNPFNISRTKHIEDFDILCSGIWLLLGRRSSCSINSPNWVDALLPPVLAVVSDLVFLAGRGLPARRGRAS
ncbi:ribonuclease H-like domain-containing protein [Tanacetum coccineum]